MHVAMLIELQLGIVVVAVFAVGLTSTPCCWLQAFVNAQNQLTVPFLEGCDVRDLFKERMTELYDYPKYSCPFKRGSR